MWTDSDIDREQFDIEVQMLITMWKLGLYEFPPDVLGLP